MSYPPVVTTPDGAKLAYDVLGAEHLGQAEAIVLVGGVSSLRGDWEKLSSVLSQIRPVLIFDHRGMGDSTLGSSQHRNDEISIDTLARDLMHLIKSLGWNEVSICGFSMGGVITQHLLRLPHLPENPTPLPFRITHVLLTGTLCSTLHGRRPALGYSAPSSGKLTIEQKKAFARPILEATFDPVWLRDKINEKRLEWWLDRAIHGRPIGTILMQLKALNGFDFTDLHNCIPTHTQILVIHGKLDEIVAFSFGEEVLKRIPTGRFVEIGDRPGQVPNLEFGHLWWEYFDIEVWRDVFEVFLKTGTTRATARL